MKKIILFTLMIAALAAFKISNSRRIHGIVSSSQDKLPIPGATVKVEGTNIGTVTDGKGAYSIDVPDGKTKLVVTFVGYQPKKVSIGKSDVLDVALDETQNQLGEVVVTTAPGIRHVQKELGYSTATASQADANKAANGLTGRVAGLAISGAPGSNASIQLRGISSMQYSARKAKAYSSNIVDANDESYAHHAENSFLAAKDNPLSTFSVDVDAASYSNVRRFINSGQLPPTDAVRVEEMINYFKYDLSGPVGNDPVAIHTELSSAPWNPKHRLLRIGLKARAIPTESLPASNLVFLIDVSGSMDEPNKLPLVKASLKMLVDQLRAKDRVAIVVYAGNAGLVLPSTEGDNKTRIKDAIDNLSAGGSTAGGEGLKLAYRIAKENFKTEGNNRIVLATDGDFNVGPSSDGDMEHLIEHERNSKVDLSIMGFGMGNYKDSKMETLADKGNGNYAYIDNLTEARKAFVTEFGGTLFTVAKDVKIQVEFNPAKVQSYRLLGYEDRMLAKEDFNNDKKDAGDMGSGHTVTAFYEIVPTGVTDDYSNSVDPLKYQKTNPVPVSPSNEMMTIKFRYKQPTDEKSKMSLVTVEDKPIAFTGTSDDFRFAAAVAEFGMLLRHSDLKQKSNFDQAISIAKAAKGKDDDGYRSEFVRLAETAKSLSRNEQLITKE